MATLPVGPGINSIPTKNIPEDPKAFVTWFKNSFLTRWAPLADVRNATQGAGISISGAVSAPATIAVNASVLALFAQPYVLLGAPVGAANLTDYRSLAAEVGYLTLTDTGAEGAVTVGVNLGMAPTWTGQHTWTDGLLVNQNASALALPAQSAGTVFAGAALDANPSAISQYAFGAGANYNMFRADGTGAVPANLANGEAIGNVVWKGYDSTGYFNGAFIQGKTTQAWNATAHGTQLNFLVVANGSTVANTAMTIDQSGAVFVDAPTSAVAALTVTSASGSFAASLLGATGDAARVSLVDGNTGNRSYQLRSGGLTAGTFDIYDSSGGSRLSIANTGAVTITAPSSGTALTVNGANAAGGLGVQINGTFTGSGNVSLLTLSDTGNTNGVNLAMLGPGAVAPNKYLRVDGGAFQILNSAYSNVMLNIDDSAQLTMTGSSAGTVNSTFTNANAAGNSNLIVNVTGGVSMLMSANSAPAGFMGTTSNHPLNLYANNATRVTIATTGAVAISTPTSGTALTINSASGYFALSLQGAVSDAARFNLIDGNTGNRTYQLRSGGLATGTFDIYDSTAGSRLAITTAGAVSIAGTLGINGNPPPAQVTGWGTPVGGAVVASYNITDAGGANSNTNKAVAEIITALKAFGLLAA